MIYLRTEFYMPCIDDSFVTALKHEALYEILIVARLFYIVWKYYKHCIFFSILRRFFLLNINHIKNVSSESFKTFPRH
jgi:hypothetical protein